MSCCKVIKKCHVTIQNDMTFFLDIIDDYAE